MIQAIRSHPSSLDPEEKLAAITGASYVALGLWPLLAIRSFESTYEPAAPRALLRLFGATKVGVGMALIGGALGGLGSSAMKALGTAMPAACIAVDAAGILMGRVSPALLVEDVLHATFLAAWLGPGRLGPASAEA